MTEGIVREEFNDSILKFDLFLEFLLVLVDLPASAFWFLAFLGIQAGRYEIFLDLGRPVLFLAALVLPWTGLDISRIWSLGSSNRLWVRKIMDGHWRFFGLFYYRLCPDSLDGPNIVSALATRI